MSTSLFCHAFSLSTVWAPDFFLGFSVFHLPGYPSIFLLMCRVMSWCSWVGVSWCRCVNMSMWRRCVMMLVCRDGAVSRCVCDVNMSSCRCVVLSVCRYVVVSRWRCVEKAFCRDVDVMSICRHVNVLCCQWAVLSWHKKIRLPTAMFAKIDENNLFDIEQCIAVFVSSTFNKVYCVSQANVKLP